MPSPSRERKLPAGVDPSRIPPGQTLTAPDRWPLLHFGPVPHADLSTWSLRVFGLAEEALELSYDEVRALPRKEVVADIHCVTGWSRLGDTWSGVAIQEILGRCRPRADVTHVMAHCELGYTTSLPLQVLDDDDVLLCYGWNGRDLSEEHGFPLRLLVPKRYFWKSAKWLRGLELMPANRLGFWEQRGYHDDADPWLEQRYW
jgi:DMSO/TMAO reductase YedYZ molybdopterin-dependent catalytic subunit